MQKASKLLKTQQHTDIKSTYITIHTQHSCLDQVKQYTHVFYVLFDVYTVQVWRFWFDVCGVFAVECCLFLLSVCRMLWKRVDWVFKMIYVFLWYMKHVCNDSLIMQMLNVCVQPIVMHNPVFYCVAVCMLLCVTVIVMSAYDTSWIGMFVGYMLNSMA